MLAARAACITCPHTLMPEHFSKELSVSKNMKSEVYTKVESLLSLKRKQQVFSLLQLSHMVQEETSNEDPQPYKT